MCRIRLLFPSEVVSSDLNIVLYYLDRGEYDKVLPYMSKADTAVATKGTITGAEFPGTDDQSALSEWKT